MKKDRLLRLCVIAALMAGGVWSIEVPGVSAKTFDMTLGKYANGITYILKSAHFISMLRQDKLN